MDLRFTPHDDRPRSTPEPLSSSPHPLQPQAEVTVSVAMVRPGNGMRSNNDREVTTNVNSGVETTSTAFRMLDNDSCNRGDEREVNGRPSSAPARTPTSAGIAVIEITGASPRPRVCRPRLQVPAVRVHSSLADIESTTNPASVPHRNASPDDLDSSDLHEDVSPDRYTELSPGPSGEPRYVKHHLVNHSHNEHNTVKCTLCSYDNGEKFQIRRHKRVLQRTNPTSMLHCDKCQFSTPTPRRMREHYSRSHNEDYGASFIAASMHMRTSTFNTNPNFSRIASGCNTDGGYFLDVGGSRALHAYRLSQPRGTLQFEPGDSSSTVIPGCGNSSFAPSAGFASFRYDSERRLLVPSDSNMASDRLNSLMSNVINHPRVPATSTITSCEYPARPSNPHRPDLNNLSPLRSTNSTFRDMFPGQPLPFQSRNRHSIPIAAGEGVRVKTEPIDCDGVSDVSSSEVSGLFERGVSGHDRPQRFVEPQTTTTQSGYVRPLYEQPMVSRSIEQSDEIAPSGGDVTRVSQSSEAASSHMDTRAGSVGENERVERRCSVGDGDSLGHHLLINIKSETSSVAVQCSGSANMKSESSPVVTVAAAEHSTECRRVRHLMIERGIQCELLSSSSSRRVTSRTLSTDSEQQSVSGSDTRCSHCGITFEDEVLFSIHIGCHSHTDPFVCNVCGKKCHNKYGFYSHIMRGHQF